MEPGQCYTTVDNTRGGAIVTRDQRLATVHISRRDDLRGIWQVTDADGDGDDATFHATRQDAIEAARERVDEMWALTTAK